MSHFHGTKSKISLSSPLQGGIPRISDSWGHAKNLRFLSTLKIVFYLFDQSSVEYGEITSILFDSVEFYKFF